MGRGLCAKHYMRIRRHGTLEGLHPHGDPFDRLMANVEKTGHGGCWIYVGKATKNGYSIITEGKTGWHYGHRLVYQRLIGPIPGRLRLHHTCEHPLCVNPSHLRPSTARGHAHEHGLGVGPCRTCGAEDWYIRTGGARQCRECRRRRRSAC